MDWVIGYIVVACIFSSIIYVVYYIDESYMYGIDSFLVVVFGLTWPFLLYSLLLNLDDLVLKKESNKEE